MLSLQKQIALFQLYFFFIIFMPPFNDNEGPVKMAFSQMKIYKYIKNSNKISPKLLLLNIIKNKKGEVLLGNLLVVAKLLVTKYWKTDKLPTKTERLIKYHHNVMLMGSLTAVKRLVASDDFFRKDLGEIYDIGLQGNSMKKIVSKTGVRI